MDPILKRLRRTFVLFVLIYFVKRKDKAFSLNIIYAAFEIQFFTIKER